MKAEQMIMHYTIQTSSKTEHFIREKEEEKKEENHP